MNQKELNEIRRRWKLDRNAAGSVYGCYVNSAKEIIAQFDMSFGLMTHDEAEMYLGILKKDAFRHAGQEPDRHRVRHGAGRRKAKSTAC